MNAVIYVLLYVLCMIPIYLLPFLSSYSALFLLTVVSRTGSLNILFLIRVAALVIMFILALARGSRTRRPWIAIFPILAAIFDLVPALNRTPIIPTLMHLCAIIIGAIGAPQPVQVGAADHPADHAAVGGTGAAADAQAE